ncbi:hypothetical protein JW897_12115 [Chromobacterium alkanivorans]|uniref:hypothetical protein n=1 Tax=Chromobacterium alkanivorans TaxID=1071719 RepID=UPI0019678EC1|nr:hypothetical protein [Chromobacterium alkanivorans]MBN3004480.1 hypothetical protein [Chromobacterium alkanivorans]
MDVKTITLEFLRQHGYDGLSGDECACKLDSLFPCGYAGTEACRAGYLQPMDEQQRRDYDFMIGPDKPEGTAA